MRNLKLLFLVHFFIIITFIIPTYGADVTKIAIVDSQKVLDKSLLGKKMKNELEKIRANYAADLEAKGKEIQKLQNEVKILSSSEKTSSVANKEELDKKSRILKIKVINHVLAPDHTDNRRQFGRHLYVCGYNEIPVL